MADATRSSLAPLPVLAPGHEVVASTVMAQLLANGWLAGHGTTQQLESFVAAMEAVGCARSARPSATVSEPAAVGAWASACRLALTDGAEPRETTRGS